MHDSAILANQPAVITVQGREYRLYDLSLQDLTDLQSWVDTKFRDPLAVVAVFLASPAGAKLAVETRKWMLAEARQAACKPSPRLGMREATEQILAMDGLREILWLSIRRGDPTFTRTDLAELCNHVTFDQLEAAIARTGIIATRPEGDGSDPKA
jgi:hypothetical protein